MNIGAGLHAALAGSPCQVLESNLKVGIAATRRFVYPDIFVVCGSPRFDPRDSMGQTVTNPRIVVEVLSPTTEAYDRSGKFNQYREINPFEEYVRVSQDRASVETFFRQADGTWLFTPCAGMEAVVKLRSIAAELPLATVYAGVVFPELADGPSDPFEAEKRRRNNWLTVRELG